MTSERRTNVQVAGAVERWSEGLEEETEFWFRWLRDHGGPWPDDYTLRTDPESELQPHIRRYLASPEKDAHLRILDVGSGPLTVLGKRWGDRSLEITAVDPLAERYAGLFERVGLEPLVRPVVGEAEHVAERFPPESFDLVYAQNCLDHGYEPMRSIQQMLELVKPGRVVLLEHALNEGEFMSYAGPHQWNFHAVDDRFEIWRPGERIDAHSMLEAEAAIDIEVLRQERWIRVALRKRPAKAQSTSQVVEASDRWTEGLEEEKDFWFRWLRDKGGPWPEDYAFKTDPESELQPYVRRYLDSQPGGHLRVLDVGSGPLTILGKKWAERTIEITAVDPLAEVYAELLEGAGLEALMRPVRGEAEHLAESFPPGSFDLVYARNCIDHGYDPLLAIQQMITVVKPGRVVFLEHAIDEGEYMLYAGPHQWNFRSDQERFVIWRPGMWVDANFALEDLVDIEIESLPEDRWIRVALRKRGAGESMGTRLLGSLRRRRR